jgi:4-hydroxy-3-polyprenylbenzoate decarboxylase
MAVPGDLREWIRLLEDEHELVRVSAEVDPDLEITEIVDRTVKSGGPALLFENPKGSRHPLLINQFGTERRMCLAFGVDRLDDVAAKLEDVLELQPPQGLVEKVRGLKKLKSIADSLPKTVSRGACQEIVLTGDDVDLGLLPIQRCWPGDPAPFITLPAVITRDPHTGVRNVGMYRMQKIDARSTYMHWQIHKDGRADYLATDGKIPVAVALGLDPVTAYSASAPLPKHIDELMLAGFLKGEPVELVKAKTVDLEVPANAEIVLEGTIEKGEVGLEGPFGDHTGYYTAAEPFPVFRLSAITMRRDAVYPSIVVGKPPQEDAWLGKATERIFLPAIKLTVPEIVDYDLPVAGAFHNCVIVSINKAFPGHAHKVMHAIWGLGMLSLSKSVVVVDAEVDVHDYAEVFFYVGANVDPKRDVVIAEGPLDHLDHAPTLQFVGGKIGIDATAKGPAEGTREWPEEIAMSEEVRSLVDRRWSEYGIPAHGDGALVQNGSRRGLRQLIRR